MVVKVEDWMPRTLPGRRAMCKLTAEYIGDNAAALELSPADVTAIVALCTEFIAVYDFDVASQANADGVTEWRNNTFSGNPKGAPLTAPPAVGDFAMPVGATIGILNQFRDWRAKWVAADGYTQAIGESMMWATPQGTGPDLATVTPTIKVSSAVSGYLAGVMVSDRAGADQWVVETRQKGGDWKNAGTFTGKAANVTITPLSPGNPEQVEFRVRLKMNNEYIGNFSVTVTVTLNP